MKKEIEAKDLTLPELRAGNWVYYKDKPRQIYYPYDRGVAFLIGVTWDDRTHTNHILYKGIKPIEITPEILEKAGFGNTVTTREGQYVQYGLKSGSWDFMFEFYNEGEPQFYLDMVGVDILYLHQLQNLYFALTNKELIINL